jgi:hypothetical protein
MLRRWPYFFTVCGRAPVKVVCLTPSICFDSIGPWDYAVSRWLLLGYDYMCNTWMCGVRTAVRRRECSAEICCTHRLTSLVSGDSYLHFRQVEWLSIGTSQPRQHISGNRHTHITYMTSIWRAEQSSRAHRSEVVRDQVVATMFPTNRSCEEYQSTARGIWLMSIITGHEASSVWCLAISLRCLQYIQAICRDWHSTYSAVWRWTAISWEKGL